MNMNNIRMKFGIRLKQLRKRKGWSQDQLARKAGLNSSYVGRIERAERNVSLEVIQKLAEALGVEIKELFTFE